MRISNYKVEELIRKSKLAYTNALNRTDIKEKVLNNAYDETRLQEELALSDDLEIKYQDQRRLAGEYKDLTERFKEKFRIENTRYMDDRKMSVKILSDEKDSAIIEILGLNQDVPNSFEGFLSLSKQFYRIANNNSRIQERLAVIGLTPEKFQAGLTGLTELNQVKHSQEEKYGDRQRATRVRDDAYKTVLRKYSLFAEACKINLRDYPQLREVLGILERSITTRKKKEEKPTDPSTPTVTVPLDNTGMAE